MAGIVGIEPTPTVLETVVLPLNYIPIIKNGREWIRTTEPEGTVLQTVAFNQTSLLLHKVARDGIEPPTHGASIRCSTN